LIYKSLSGKLDFELKYLSNRARQERGQSSFASSFGDRLLDYTQAPYSPIGSCQPGYVTTGALQTFSYCFQPTSPSTNEVVLDIAGNTVYKFQPGTGSTFTSETADVTDQVQKITSGAGAPYWLVTRNQLNRVEQYSVQGQLLARHWADGSSISLDYSTSSDLTYPNTGLLKSVTDQFGRKLVLAYSADSRLASLTDPAGGIYSFTYDSSGNLTTVSFPDGHQKRYWYNEPAFNPNAQANVLTGITDENGNRIGTYTYDGAGYAIRTEAAGGVNGYDFNYFSPGYGTSVTDPLGTHRTYSFATINNAIQLTSLSQPAGAGSSAASSTITYDANGNISSQTDFDGNLKTYSYDLSRNLETQRVEASGTASAHTISSAWHPNWYLKIKQAEPKKLMIWVYNGQPDPSNGNAILTCAPVEATVNGLPIAVLCKQIEQATTDANGSAGLSPTVTGTTRVWAYTYNADGQVLTASGPRTDVADTTTYVYRSATDTSHSSAQYTRGDLYTITNAQGQVTTIPVYDLNGRPLQIVDPNGLTTVLTYSPRGWLTSRAVSGNSVTETTTYNYDYAGQLTKVTQPDGSYLNYTYDAAHRLTDITDNLGNTVHYTLDNMGNRTTEAVKDPSNTLPRQINRVYDALNRLQTITGALQ
jgi:YD repeat-containing protein